MQRDYCGSPSWFGESLKEFPKSDFPFQISQPNLQDGCAQNVLVMGRRGIRKKWSLSRNFRFSWDELSQCLKLSHIVSPANILIFPMSETLSHQPLSPPTSVDFPDDDDASISNTQFVFSVTWSRHLCQKLFALLSMEVLLSVSWRTEMSRREKTRERNIWDRNVAEMCFSQFFQGRMEQKCIFRKYYFINLSWPPFYQQENTRF